MQAELLSGFQAKKPGRKSKHSKSLLEANLEELPCLILVVIDSFLFLFFFFFLKVPETTVESEPVSYLAKTFLEVPT